MNDRDVRTVDDRTGLSGTTRSLLIAVLTVGITHHVDHVLRVDHSGWPFRAGVNPFTYSLLAYPVLLFALLGPARLIAVRWTLLLAGTCFTLFAHLRIETPRMQYAMWAYNRSLEPELWNIRNLCGIESGPLGIVSVAIAMTLNILLVVVTIAMFRDWRSGQPDRNSATPASRSNR